MKRFCIPLTTIATIALGAMLLTPDADAQQKTGFMFDADTYWDTYWQWYDTEYVPASQLPPPGPVVQNMPDGFGGGYLGESAATTGAPDAGGDYDDYPARYYAPGGTTEYYLYPVPGPRRRAADRAPADTPPGAPAAANAERPRAATEQQGARRAPDLESVPPDIDAPTPAARAPETAAEPEIWY